MEQQNDGCIRLHGAGSTKHASDCCIQDLTDSSSIATTGIDVDSSLLNLVAASIATLDAVSFQGSCEGFQNPRKRFSDQWRMCLDPLPSSIQGIVLSINHGQPCWIDAMRILCRTIRSLAALLYLFGGINSPRWLLPSSLFPLLLLLLALQLCPSLPLLL